MKVVFRVDASVKRGIGHLMRCLTLANALFDIGMVSTFVCREESKRFIELNNIMGHETLLLPDGLTSQEDSLATKEYLSAHAPWDWLVVDHYEFDAKWERNIKDVCSRILVIDDLADRTHDCDILLDQNLQTPERYSSLLPDSCMILTGPKYAMLRPQFLEERKKIKKRRGRISRVLLFFGGTDPERFTLKALSACRILNDSSINIDVVIGESHPERKNIEAASREIKNVSLKYQVDNMAELMNKADLYLGAGGTTSWERCCLGLPSLIIATADNQVETSELLAQAGAQIYLGESKRINPERMASALKEIMQLPELVSHLSTCAYGLVDGNGASRIAALMDYDTLQIRPATKKDSNMILEWRNHEEVRRYSFNSEMIKWSQHKKWFTELLADSNRNILITEEKKEPAGVLRFDINNYTANISIFLKPGKSGRNLGRRTLLVGEEWIKNHHPKIKLLKASVAKDNYASHGMFVAAGFQEDYLNFKKELKTEE